MKYGAMRSIYASLEIDTPIEIEIDISQGLFSFDIVGLAGKTVEEARQRIYAAIRHSGYPSPKTKNHKIVVSLSPGHIHKNGTHFDAAIALSYLSAAREIDIPIHVSKNICIIGELTLEGNTVACPHLFPLITAAKQAGFTYIVYPYQNSGDIPEHDAHITYPYTSLTELIALSLQITEKELGRTYDLSHTTTHQRTSCSHTWLDGDETYRETQPFKHIKGQVQAKKGIVISLCGFHHALLWGSPGTGKTLLGEAAGVLQPMLSREDAEAVARIYSYKGEKYRWGSAPYRSPHHTMTKSTLLGGRVPVIPGEISLAHKGILALHEFTEMKTEVRESLREVMEHAHISARTQTKAVILPAACIILATCNPCPCGNYASTVRCYCSPPLVQRYIQRVSGALWDRFSVCIHVKRDPDTANTSSDDNKKDEKYTEIRSVDIERIRTFSQERNRTNFGTPYSNNTIPHHVLDSYFNNTYPQLYSYLWEYCTQKKLSLRTFHATLRIALTIAHIEEKESVEMSHIHDAMSYRMLPHFSNR